MLPLLKLMFCQSMAATSADMDQTEWLNSFWHIFGLCCVRLHSVGIAEHNVLAVAFCQVSIVLGVAALGNRSGAVTVCIHWRRHDCIVRSTISLYWHQPYIILAMPFALVFTAYYRSDRYSGSSSVIYSHVNLHGCLTLMWQKPCANRHILLGSDVTLCCVHMLLLTCFKYYRNLFVLDGSRSPFFGVFLFLVQLFSGLVFWGVFSFFLFIYIFFSSLLWRSLSYCGVCVRTPD